MSLTLRTPATLPAALMLHAYTQSLLMLLASISYFDSPLAESNWLCDACLKITILRMMF